MQTRGKTRAVGAFFSILIFAAGCGAAADRADSAATKAAAAPRVAIVEPEDGATFDAKSVLIVLANENIEIAPAGDTRPGTGHHHLFVNAPPVGAGEPIPAGLSAIVHLGKAQISHELVNLPSGEYTVIAVIGDLGHCRIEPQVTDTVRFRVR